MLPDNFTNIPFDIDNLDRVVIRTNIFKAITGNITKFKGDFLDIGCGKMPYKDYILQHSSITKYVGLDIETAIEYDADVKPDFTWDGNTMPFDSGIFETVFATEVLEHCPRPEVLLKEAYRVLKPGGAFFFTVPFLWPLHEVPHDEYRYTPYSLQRLLTETGFIGVAINATGGWHASLAQMLGLWVRRAPLAEKRKKYLSLFIKPVMKQLLKWERYSTVEFKEGQMITGLTGIGYK